MICSFFSKNYGIKDCPAICELSQPQITAAAGPNLLSQQRQIPSVSQHLLISPFMKKLLIYQQITKFAVPPSGGLSSRMKLMISQ